MPLSDGVTGVAWLKSVDCRVEGLGSILTGGGDGVVGVA